jgi:hypothetical protein
MLIITTLLIQILTVLLIYLNLRADDRMLSHYLLNLLETLTSYRILSLKPQGLVILFKSSTLTLFTVYLIATFVTHSNSSETIQEFVFRR